MSNLVFLGGNSPYNRADVFERAFHRAQDEAARAGVHPLDAGAYAMKRWAESGMGRGDAAGSIPAGLLTASITPILQTPFPPLDGMQIPHRAETPLGAAYSRYFRYVPSGEMAHYTGNGQPVPRVNEKIDEQIFPIARFVTAVSIDVFEQQGSNYAQIVDIMAGRIRGAQTVHAQGHNKIVWNGYSGTGLRGVFQQPGVARYFNFSHWFASATTGQTIVQEFGQYVTWLASNTRSVGNLDRVLIASKLWALLSSKTFSTLSSDTVLTVLRRNYPSITIVGDVMHSLNDVGPSGEHAMVGFFSQDPNSLYCDLVQPFTMLPAQLEGFETVIYCYHIEGGVKSHNAYNALIGFVSTSTS